MALKLKLLLAGGALAIIAVIVALIYHSGKETARTEEKVKVYETDIKANERKAAVPVPDSASTVKRLRAGTF